MSTGTCWPFIRMVCFGKLMRCTRLHLPASDLFSLGWVVNGNANHDLERIGRYHWLGAWWMNNLPSEAVSPSFYFTAVLTRMAPPLVLSEVVAWQRGGPVSKEHVNYLMGKGENVAILPGGFEEATLFRKGRHLVQQAQLYTLLMN